jgi:hypothetical protein
MKKALFLALTVTASLAFADNYVQPHVRQDGTFVQGHYQTAPDRNPYNNYTTQGNSNPYTGQQGTRSPERVQQEYANPYKSGGNYGSQPQRQNNKW